MALKASEEQVLYAKILNAGMLFGLVSTIICFALYATEIMTPKVSLDKIQEYWLMPVKDYLKLSGIHTGWAWISDLGYGDMLNLFPIAFLSALTIICYLAILPGLIRKKDTAYVVLAILEVLVLVLAASGILKAGGH